MNPFILFNIYKKMTDIFIGVHYNKPYKRKDSYYYKKKLYFILNFWLNKHLIKLIIKFLGGKTYRLLDEDYYYISVITKKVKKKKGELMYTQERKFMNNEKSGLIMSTKRLREYIINSYWSFDKNYVKIPYFYTVRYWDMNKEQIFVDFIYHILENGKKDTVKMGGKYINRIYYDFEGFRYWIIKAPVNKIWVINREIKNRKKIKYK